MNLLIEGLQGGVARKVYLCLEKVAGIIPDPIYLKIIYRIRMGQKLNLKNPITLNDKWNWLKLNDRKPYYTKMVDKYEVKKIIADKIGESYVIPTLGVWDSFDDIDFDKLPDQFVLKCTHDSGSVLICRDKLKLDIPAERKKFNKALKRDYYLSKREWPYKNVPRRIIAEPYIESLGNEDSIEYKITCFNGKVVVSTICTGKAHSLLKDRRNDHYDRDFNRLPFYIFYKPSDNPITEKPKELYKIEEFAEKISEGIPHLRVDFYILGDQILFGETTFFTWAGFSKFEPDEYDMMAGELLELPKDITR